MNIIRKKKNMSLILAEILSLRIALIRVAPYFSKTDDMNELLYVKEL